MSKCVLLLAVLGLSTSYHHHGHGNYQSHPAYPSHRPDQWSHPGDHGPHETSHSENWHYHSGYQDGLKRFNPNESPTGNTGQLPKPSPTPESHYLSQTDQGGNVSGETDDKVKNPFIFHQESNGKLQNDTLERGIGQSDTTGQIAVTNSKPFTTGADVRTNISMRADPGIGGVPVTILKAPTGEIDRWAFSTLSLVSWNVGIYTKMTTPYSQICGGSLVKTDAVLTAAHCFWGDGGALRPALFAAAAGKVLRTWDAEEDVFAQKSDIKEIHIPPRFRGAMTSFQDDIAIARLSSPFEYELHVQPVCVDFDLAMEREQFQRGGSKGTIVGWGLTEPNGPPSETLNFLELPYLEITECLKLVPSTFIKYITSDKICAGDFKTGIAVCKGDSGGGLVYRSEFLESSWRDVPYIRGIISTAPRDANKYECNPYTPATFTQITAHMTFLTDHIPNIAEDCRTLYEFEVQNATVENDSKGIGSGETNIAENCRMMSEVQRTVEKSVGNESGGNSNVASGQLKTNVTAQSEERKSNWLPISFRWNTSTGQRHECNCFCN